MEITQELVNQSTRNQINRTAPMAKDKCKNTSDLLGQHLFSSFSSMRVSHHSVFKEFKFTLSNREL